MTTAKGVRQLNSVVTQCPLTQTLCYGPGTARPMADAKTLSGSEVGHTLNLSTARDDISNDRVLHLPRCSTR